MSELIINGAWIDIAIDDCADNDNLLGFSLGQSGGCIEKQHAIDIIKHLSKVFNIDLKNIGK